MGWLTINGGIYCSVDLETILDYHAVLLELSCFGELVTELHCQGIN